MVVAGVVPREHEQHSFDKHVHNFRDQKHSSTYVSLSLFLDFQMLAVNVVP